jgi:hypothetical protein
MKKMNFVDSVTISQAPVKFNFFVLDYRGLQQNYPKLKFCCKNNDSDYKPERRNKTMTYLKYIKGGICNISSRTIQKISLKIFEEMRQIFQNIFDQKF